MFMGSSLAEIIDYVWQIYLVAAMFFLLTAVIFQRAWYLGLGIAFILTAFLAMMVSDLRTHIAIGLILAFIFVSYFMNKDQLVNHRLREQILEQRLLGQVGLVVEDIDNPSRRGQVRIGNDIRNAASADGGLIQKGKRVFVQKVDGTRIVVGDVNKRA
jgi:membrane protein implicated in regulation of membrane protease activity